MAQLELPSAARVAEVLAVLGPGGRIRSVGELERALGDVCGRGGLQLAGLHGVLAGMPAALQATFWARVLPSLCARLGALRALFPEPIPLLVQGRAAAVSLSKAQAAALLSAMFLLCLPEQGASTGEPWPAVSMRRLLSSAAPQEMAKLRALLHYFGRALGGEGGGDGDETGTLTFRRLVLPPLAPDAWAASRAPMSSLRVLGQGHAIEEAAGCLQADFANAYLGGGVLSGGCVQEEIRFALCPELIAGMALCAAMRDDEALLMTGAERYSDYEGYAFGLRWGGDHVDATPRMGGGAGGAPATCIVAFDAVDLRGAGSPERALRAQLQRPMLLREANKALVAFTPSPEAEAGELAGWPFKVVGGGGAPTPGAVATGNWGCGAFLGDLQVKAVLQWLAASIAGRPIEYYSFGEPGLDDGLRHLARALGLGGAALQEGAAVAGGEAAAAAAAAAPEVASVGFVFGELLRFADAATASSTTTNPHAPPIGLFQHLVAACTATSPHAPPEVQAAAPWRGEEMLRVAAAPWRAKRHGAARRRRHVAVIEMVGTFCPVTLGHVQAFVQAREILLGRAATAATAEGGRIDAPFDFVLGWAGFNSERHAVHKLEQNGELPPEGARRGISVEDRKALMAHATRDLPWLTMNEDYLLEKWAEKFPELTFVAYSLNGADDVVKYQKWNHCSETNRHLTLGRPGFTEQVREGIARSGADPRWCVLAPELPDISSTDARAALRANDAARLCGLLDSRVTAWCVRHGAYGCSSGGNTDCCSVS